MNLMEELISLVAAGYSVAYAPSTSLKRRADVLVAV